MVMALSNQDKIDAKNQAKQYLEYSIYQLALILGVNPEGLDDSFVNPETPDTDLVRYKSFENLIKQIAAYTAITG